MKQEAIKRINAEMQKKPGDQHLEIVGHYVIDRIQSDNSIYVRNGTAKADAATDVVNGGKSLSSCMAALEAAARRKARSNVGALVSTEIYSIIDEYFGFAPDGQAQQAHARSVCAGEKAGTVGAASETPPAPSGDALDLTDFL